VNERLKFLLKLLTAVPKSTPKRHTNKSYKNSSHQELRDPKDVPQITRNPTQKTKLESETEQVRNGSQQHRLRAADSPLQYSTVPRTVRGSTADSPQVKKTLKRTSRKQFCSRLKNNCYSTSDSPGLGAGQSASTNTVQQRKHRKNLNSLTVRYSTADCPRITK
jgi:hypothetical protein